MPTETLPSSTLAARLALLMRPFGDVRADELLSTLTMTLAVFVQLTGYYFLKVVREPLILQQAGAEAKTYASAGQLVLIVLVVRGHSMLAKRLGRFSLVAAINLGAAAILAAFAGAMALGLRVGVAFYLFVGVFSLTVLAQLWAFANDIYTPEQGKRLFAILGIGSSVGAVVGARIAGSAYGLLGPASLVLAAAGLVVVVTLTLRWLDARMRASAAASGPDRGKHEDAPVGGQDAWRILFSDRYLLLIAALSLLLNWVNTTGEYVLDRTLLDVLGNGVHSPEVGRRIAEFKGGYFGWVNLVGMLLQLFAASRVMKLVGVRGTLFVLPLVSLSAYGLMAFYPLLAAVRVAKVAENSIDYSIENTVRQALYLVTSRSAKYTAKTLIDTFMVRMGDVSAAVTIFVGTEWLHAGTKAFVGFNLALVGAWLLVVGALGREHRAREAALDRAGPSATASAA